MFKYVKGNLCLQFFSPLIETADVWLSDMV